MFQQPKTVWLRRIDLTSLVAASLANANNSLEHVPTLQLRGYADEDPEECNNNRRYL